MALLGRRGDKRSSSFGPKLSDNTQCVLHIKCGYGFSEKRISVAKFAIYARKNLEIFHAVIYGYSNYPWVNCHPFQIEYSHFIRFLKVTNKVVSCVL